MTLTYPECLALCKLLSSTLHEAKVSHVYLGRPRYFYLEFQSEDGASSWMMICMQNPFLRFHPLKHAPHNCTLHPVLDRKLRGMRLQGLEVLNEDRIVDFSFREGTSQLSLRIELFPKKPNVYLLDSQGGVLWSLNSAADVYSLPEKPPLSDFASEPVDPEQVIARYRMLEREEALRRAKSETSQLVTRKLKQLCKRRQKLLDQQRDAERWPALKHEADLLQSCFYQLRRGSEQVDVADWEADGVQKTLKLDPLKTPQENVDAYYKRVKKAKRSLQHLELQLESLAAKEAELEKLSGELAKIEDLKQLDRWRKKLGVDRAQQAPQPKVVRQKSRYREFETASGLKILVGKSDRDNDYLSFSVGRGSDWWFHASGVAGAHVVLKLNKKDQIPDPDSVADAMQVALHYSKAKKRGEADVIVTQCKYLSKASGKAGRVHVSKHKTYLTRLDEERYRLLKERSQGPL